ncbi:flagellar associated protein calmodulin [Echinococcus multilocularis]|uniref:Flagellar associated protein calmodulin n=1 Tax=Echinococcus multilocularis TaxID=6211 RepID=A0A068YAC8_ECHMU|nr:flagellar associated protein calmodulin [Echinococcus multilocularis]
MSINCAPPPKESEKLDIPAEVLKMSEVVFKELDKDSRGKIPISSVVQALQLLDQAPTEKEVREIVEEQKLDGGSDERDTSTLGRISFEKFSQLLKTIYLPPEEHFKRLFNAFAVLDDKNKGILAADYLSELLLTRGDALTKKQVRDLMSESSTAADGYFAYMSFIGK